MKKTLAILTILSGSAFADSGMFDVTDAPKEKAHSDSVMVAISSGTLFGSATELTYDTSTGKNSNKREWKINNLNLLKADLSWIIDSSTTLSASGWLSLYPGSGQLNEGDFSSETAVNSQYADTDVKYGNQFDLNMKIWVRQKSDSKVALLVGYQATRFSWNAYRDSNQSAQISDYSQTLSMPYLGLTSIYLINDFELKALVKYTNKVSIEALDENYKSKSSSEQTVSNGSYYGGSLGAGYYLTPHFKLFTDVSYSLYTVEKGQSTVTNTENQVVTKNALGSVGIGNSSYSIAAGIEYSF